MTEGLENSYLDVGDDLEGALANDKGSVGREGAMR